MLKKWVVVYSFGINETWIPLGKRPRKTRVNAAKPKLWRRVSRNMVLLLSHSCEVSMCDLLKTYAGEISDFFFSLSSHKKILRNTWLIPIWSMEKCSAMPAVHQKVDVDGVFSAWVRVRVRKTHVFRCNAPVGKPMWNAMFSLRLPLQENIRWTPRFLAPDNCGKMCWKIHC